VTISRFFLASATILTSLSIQAAALADVPDHVFWAVDLAENVAPEYNTYDSNPNYVYWVGVAGATRYENRTTCSNFLTRVLKQSYGFSDTDLKTWLGATNPAVIRYYTAIVEENGFLRISNIDDVLPADIVAVAHPPGGTVTGHVSIAISAPVPRISTTPIVPGTYQYELEIVDSSSSGHGPLDTRRLPNGEWQQGAGIGIMRLYTDEEGVIVGHTWSTYSTSLYYDETTRPIAIGRLPPQSP